MGRKLAETFIKLVKKARESKGYSQEYLADLSNVHRTTIGLLEKGERLPTLQVASQISKALDIPLSNLIKESEDILYYSENKEKLLNQNSRTPSTAYLRNADKLLQYTGLQPQMLLEAINSCYQTLDVIDSELRNKNAPPLAHTVELANLSSMVGNMLGAGIADNSQGLYLRNKPHAYPDLLPQGSPAVDLELKMALETNKPKGHLPKAGTYITFRYVLGDSTGQYTRGKDYRGDTVWIWEVKVGQISEQDFSCSNTAGDSGKTAVIKTDVFNNMHLVYYNEDHLPYAQKAAGGYVGFN